MRARKAEEAREARAAEEEGRRVGWPVRVGGQAAVGNLIGALEQQRDAGGVGWPAGMGGRPAGMRPGMRRLAAGPGGWPEAGGGGGWWCGCGPPRVKSSSRRTSSNVITSNVEFVEVEAVGRPGGGREARGRVVRRWRRCRRRGRWRCRGEAEVREVSGEVSVSEVSVSAALGG